VDRSTLKMGAHALQERRRDVHIPEAVFLYHHRCDKLTPYMIAILITGFYTSKLRFVFLVTKP
jgi:hypothetical protein